jgi:hypothetical protein
VCSVFVQQLHNLTLIPSAATDEVCLIAASQLTSRYLYELARSPIGLLHTQLVGLTNRADNGHRFVPCTALACRFLNGEVERGCVL